MRVFLAWVTAGVFAGLAQAADWPVSPVVVASTSPDGRYGILTDDGEHPGDETREIATHIADLKEHRILGRIRASYSAGMSLSVLWASDSSWAVATYGVSYGFRSIVLLQPSASGLKETSLGDRLHKETDGMGIRTLQPFIREGARGQIEFRATGTSDPRGRDPKPVYAYFRGHYDPVSATWTDVKTRTCSEAEWETLSAAYTQAAIPADETVEEKAERLDSRLNAIYDGLHGLLPGDRFAALRKEQREWLGGGGRAADLAKKNVRTEARVIVLEKLLWSL